MTTPFPFVAASVLEASQLNAITTLPIATKTANYVAVVGDVGKRIVMNMAGANTITINNSIFAEGDTIFLANKGAGATTITAGAGVTINTSGLLVLAQYGGGTLVALSASVFNFFSGSGANSYGVATGGSSSSITVSGQAYTLLTFTSDDNLVVSTAGLFDVCLISGGAGGSGNQVSGDYASVQRGSGGGAGGSVVLVTGIQLSAATYAVNLGAGGAGGTGGASNQQGSRSEQSNIGSVIATAIAGAGGSPNNTTTSYPSGGAGKGQTGGSALTIANFYSYAGGDGSALSNGGGGGGAGAGAVGANGSANTGGAGGAGIDVGSLFISGSLFKAGGGGGGGNSTGGAGGSSVGGAGGTTSTAGSAAAANTGSGGGGASETDATARSGGAGGSGIIYVRFEI